MPTAAPAVLAPARPARTHIALLVDRSGSMYRIAEDTEGGIAAFLADQAALPGVCTATLYEFDDTCELVYGPVPVGQAPPYRLHPRGRTALFDAFGRVIGDTAATCAATGTPRRVVVVVATDGKENASKELTRDALAGQVAASRAAGWGFVFMSADPLAVAEARGLGVPEGSSAGFAPTAEGTRSAYRKLSDAVTDARTAGTRVRLAP